MNYPKHKVIKVKNRKKEILYGILSSPTKEPKDKLVIIFCQAGLALKSGVGNQFKLMCENLAQRYHVLRFDQSGTGDSQGFVASNIPMDEFFLMVMRGCFVDDTLEVIRWTHTRFPGFNIILMGQCGGCLTAAYAGAKEIVDIRAFILLAPPVLYLPETKNKKTTVRSFDAQRTLSMYFEKIFSLKSYINLLKGQSDMALFYNSLAGVIKNKFKKILLSRKRNSSLQPHERFNWMFWEAFLDIIKRKKPVFFIFPELDNETYDFNMEFRPRIKKYLSSGLIKIEYIPECEHSLMFKRERIYLDDMLSKWLERLVSGKNSV